MRLRRGSDVTSAALFGLIIRRGLVQRKRARRRDLQLFGHLSHPIRTDELDRRQGLADHVREEAAFERLHTEWIDALAKRFQGNGEALRRAVEKIAHAFDNRIQVEFIRDDIEVATGIDSCSTLTVVMGCQKSMNHPPDHP